MLLVGERGSQEGAPAMLGKERGAVTRMKEDKPHSIAYHCLFHQSVLFASLMEELSKVMGTMTKLRVINFL